MTPERWELVKKVLEAAWEQDDAGRAAYLEQACAEDPELRSRVEALLASDEQIGEFLVSPAIRQDSSGHGLVRAALAESTETQIEPHEDSEWIGKRIGRYEITALIGKGGMGAVYRAVREDDFQMEVAIKLLKRGTDTEAALSRFRTERQILAWMQHPNIARLLDGGATDDGFPYLVMEYVDGPPLLEYASPLPVRERLELFRSVCSAVQHAHQSMIVHRDIKPDNILVTAGGVPKLLDFGIAKLFEHLPEGSTAETATGAHLMTPAYASPEQVRGEPVTKATDIYSLGAVLYELLTGRRAHYFETYSPGEIEEEICAREPKKPSTVVKDLDPDLDNIVLMALRKEPERRYASVEQFSGDLDRFLNDLPVLARKESLTYRSRKFLKRNRVPVIAAVLSAFMVLGLVAGLGRALAWRAPWRPTATPIRSIAVLPLQNLSGDPSQNYFADGLTDELTTNLARIGSLRVISRTSTLQYAENRKPMLQIGKELHVDAVIEGSVVRSGNRVRITAQLIDARHDAHLWAQSYERDLGEILELQDSVARDIASQVKASFSPEARAAFASHRLVNPGAYEAYLRGRNEIGRQTQDAIRNSVQHFQRAIDLDPLYATAYAGLADSFSLMANYSVLPPKEVFPRAEAAARKALDLDPGSPEAHASLAFAKHHFDWDWPGAEAEYQRAIQLSPSFPMAHLRYAEYLSNAGRHEEAIREIGRARELDPLSLTVAVNFGSVLFFARRYDDAIREFRAVLALNPNRIYVHMFLGMAYEQKRMYPEAIAEFKQIASGVDLARAYALAGQAGEARRVLRDVERPSANGRWLEKTQVWLFIAGVYTALGDREQAFAWLEEAYENRDFFMTYLNVDPSLDALHSDARFVRLQERVGVSKGPSSP